MDVAIAYGYSQVKCLLGIVQLAPNKINQLNHGSPFVLSDAHESEILILRNFSVNVIKTNDILMVKHVIICDLRIFSCKLRSLCRLFLNLFFITFVKRVKYIGSHI